MSFILSLLIDTLVKVWHTLLVIADGESSALMQTTGEEIRRAAIPGGRRCCRTTRWRRW